MASTFEKETRVVPEGDGYRATLDPSWWVWDGPNGGYVAAAMLRAIRAKLPSAGPLRDLTVSFLEPADAGLADIEVGVHHEGGSVAVAGARLTQAGNDVASARATFGGSREGPIFVAADPPEAASWADGHPLDGEQGIQPPRFTQHCEYRLAGGAAPLAGDVGDDMRVWMRMAEPTPMDEALVVFLSDAWMAAVYALLDRPVPVPTLDLSVQVHALPEDHGGDEPLLGVFRAEHARDGYAFEDGTLWTAGGELVARARQTRALLG